MDEGRERVLNMLQEGKISAEEAAELLEALDAAAGPAPELESPEPVIQPVSYPVRAELPPDLARFRRYWQIPFFGALILTILIALWLRSLYRSSDGGVTLGFGCVLSLFILMTGLTLLALLSRRAPWIHVRVQEAGGSRVAISLPLPIRLARWGLQLARGYVGADVQEHLDTAAAFLDAAGENRGGEPLTISVNEEGGDRVQIYIG
jgi:hypothetical protein